MNDAEWKLFGELSEEEQAKISGGNTIDKSTELSDAQCSTLKQLEISKLNPYLILAYGARQPLPNLKSLNQPIENPVQKEKIDNTETKE